MKEVNLKIQFTNRWLYSFCALGLFVICVLSVYAYNSGAGPAVMGHSGEEIHVSVNGETVTLQEAYNGLNNKINEQLNCQTFEFDALDASGTWRYFEWTLPFDCAHPENGGFGCTWDVKVINSAGTIVPYSYLGKLSVLNVDSTYYLQSSSYLGGERISVISDSSNSQLDIRSRANNDYYYFITHDHTYDGSFWNNDEGEPYTTFGSYVHKGNKIYLQICEQQPVNNLTSGIITSG